MCILEQRLILTLAREQNGDLAARAAYTATSRAHVFLGVLDGRTGALIWAAFFLLSLSLFRCPLSVRVQISSALH